VINFTFNERQTEEQDAGAVRIGGLRGEGTELGKDYGHGKRRGSRCSCG